MARGRTGVGVLVSVLAAGLLVACGASTRSADYEIVASTDVYGSIAEELIAGVPAGRIGVTSIIGDPAVDPHSYEASPRNELAISRGDLIVENGGGYDSFVDTLRDAAGADAPVINAVELSGRADDADLNEHVWFDFPTVEKVAQRISAFLIRNDRVDAHLLRRNAQSFATRLHQLESEAAQLKEHYGGTGVAITEPVPYYLLAACGLVDRTPTEFSNAIEEERDAAPGVLRDTLDLFASHQVRLLVYNEQTGGPQTDQLVRAADEAQVPALGITETLPDGAVSYLDWMADIIAAVRSALT